MKAVIYNQKGEKTKESIILPNDPPKIFLENI